MFIYYNIGRDETIVLLPVTDKTTAKSLAEKTADERSKSNKKEKVSTTTKNKATSALEHMIFTIFLL